MTWIRDAPKWTFLAEAEQNETLGRRPNNEDGLSHLFLPHVGLYIMQKKIQYCIIEIAKISFLLFCPAFQKNKMYLTLKSCNILSDIIQTKHNLTKLIS